ncbi:MAG: hypothetical protein OIF54_17240, partial [Cohaesibacter sp.]|nr:hypothetical protein [Cohaesibacter sp.]
LDFCCFGLIPFRDYHHVKYLEVMNIYRSAWQAHCGDWLSRYSTRRETAAACGALGLCCRTHRGFLAVDPAVASLSGKSKKLEIISLPSLLLLLAAAFGKDNTKGSLVEQIKVLNSAK